MLDALDGEVVLIAIFVGAVAAFVVDADDVIHTAAVAGEADDGLVRRGGVLRRE